MELFHPTYIGFGPVLQEPSTIFFHPTDVFVSPMNPSAEKNQNKSKACPWTSQKNSCGIPGVLGISLGPKHLLSRSLKRWWVPALGGGFQPLVVGSSPWWWVPALGGYSLEKKYIYKVGPLLVINGVKTPISRVK